MPYTGVYVFGDSLVDSGNALKLANLYGDLTFSDLPDGTPSAALGYYDGRFSNGYTFADLLANKAADRSAIQRFRSAMSIRDRTESRHGLRIRPHQP